MLRPMRFVAASIVLCAACFPYDEGSEYVRVTVPVYQGGAEVSVSGGRALAGPAAPDPCDAPAPDIATCTPIASVRVRDVSAEPNCYYDTKIKNGEVGRLMQCPAGQLVVFDRGMFVGLSSGEYVNACASSTYDFPQGDDCTWRTEQRIAGSTNGPLAYSYSESPVAGRDCTLACRAHATLDVLR